MVSNTLVFCHEHKLQRTAQFAYFSMADERQGVPC
jgi:hypothetical protein